MSKNEEVNPTSCASLISNCKTACEFISKALEDKPKETQQLFLAAFGVGTQVGVLLPFSRTQESEADHLGLIFMAMAGYDPHEAVNFWQRMVKMSKGKNPPEFLSTHPSDETRVRQLKKWLPEALKYYHQTKGVQH